VHLLFASSNSRCHNIFMEENKNNSNTNSSPAASASPDKSSVKNFEPNVTAVFSYILPPVTGIVFFLLEKNNKFVKFHAFQSILFGFVSYALMSLANLLRMVYIGYFIAPLVGFAVFVAWLYLMWQAYQNIEFELPYLGKIAKEQANK
jgi:uncharacterized membrane protein